MDFPILTRHFILFLVPPTHSPAPFLHGHGLILRKRDPSAPQQHESFLCAPFASAGSASLVPLFNYADLNGAAMDFFWVPGDLIWSAATGEGNQQLERRMEESAISPSGREIKSLGL
ncbi:unnamed protein product [Urochloa humidicola]